ncbi:MAG: low molecular weight phosphotyrosine protein phosphatase [Myxococcota bacterium]
MATKLLFVCSGNITRSPIAAALAVEQALTLAIDVEVQSAGTLRIDGAPANVQMEAAAREVGIDLSRHRSQPLTEELVRWADFIAAMEPHHLEAIEALDPVARDRSRALGSFVGKPEIVDPTGSWFIGPYRRTRDELRLAVERFLFDVLRPSRPSPEPGE